MTKKKTPPQASPAKQLRRQFGGAFGKAPPNLQHFLISDLPPESQDKVKSKKADWVVPDEATTEAAKERLYRLINGDTTDND